MLPQLEAGLALLRKAVNESTQFDPSQAQREFRVATSDYGQLIALPHLLERLRKGAPDVSVRVVPGDRNSLMALARGSVDLVLGGNLPSAPDLIRRGIGEEGFLVMMRRDHPARKRKFDLDAYLSYGHLLVAPRGVPGSTVDSALTALGKRRRVVLTVPQFVVAPLVLVHTDLLLTAPEGVPKALEPHLKLVTRPPPLVLPKTPLEVMWHARSQSDPAHRWFRRLIIGDDAETPS